jgi:hypothetical protein
VKSWNSYEKSKTGKIKARIRRVRQANEKRELQESEPERRKKNRKLKQ